MTPERRALANLESLRDAGGSTDLRLTAALAIIRTTLNAPLAKVLELCDSGAQLTVCCGIGWHEGVVGHATVPATNLSMAGYALRQRQAVIFSDIQGISRLTDAMLLRRHEVRSSIAVRIVAEDRPIGVLSLHELSLRPFTDRDADFIERAAPTIAALLLSKPRL